MTKNSQKPRSLRENEIVQWKKIVTVKKLKCFGKIARAPEEIPAKVALRYGLSNYVRPQGKPKTTWSSKIKENSDFLGLRQRTSQLKTIMIALEPSSNILIFDLYLKTSVIFR